MEGITVTHPVIEEVLALSSKASWIDAVAWCDANLPAWRLNLQRPVEHIDIYSEDEDEE